MKLSTRTRYGIRAMLEIALHDGVKPVDLNEISRNQDISKKYLHMLLVALKNKGLLNSVRGNAGGYRLAKKPAEISLFEIYTTLEGPAGLVDCIGNPGVCKRSETCATRRLWDRLSTAIRRELEGTTLADLVQDSAGKCDLMSFDI
jgi:Rrf2 family transcriptional regulator, cysteine metabolism repressor